MNPNNNPNDNNLGIELLDAAGDGQTRNCVRTLLAGGAAANQVGNNGCTPLLYAAAHGHAEIVRVLLGHGVDANQASNNGWAPLLYAAQYGHTEVVSDAFRG